MNKGEKSGNGVVTASSPGVASEQSFYGKVQAFEGPVFPDRFHGILRAGRGIAASGRFERRYAILVEFDREQENEDCNLFQGFHEQLFEERAPV